MKHGINKESIKIKNRGLVLKLIASNKNLSRSEITKLIGLTKMSISNIVGELIECNYVIETETADNKQVGRNPISLAISPDAPNIVGTYISRDHLHVFLCTISGHILWRTQVVLEKETSETLTQKLIVSISEAISKTPSSVLGIGISAIGPLDSKSGVILNPTNFFHIHDYPIVSILKEYFKLPVTLNNDMNTSALIEQLYGYGSSFQNFIYLGISNGIGSGIISAGKLFQDSSGFVGEIGHMGIDCNGPLCSCGRRGCLELYANMPLILDRLKKTTHVPSLTYSDFKEIHKFPECNSVFQEMVHALSYALINITNILDPDAIIIGHEGIYLPDKYLTEIESCINHEILASGHKHVKVLKSSFGIDTPLIGSISILLDDLFTGRINPFLN